MMITHLLFRTRELLRYPGYTISTLVFPAMFFSIFAAPNVEDAESARQFTVSFMMYGLLGAVFFQTAIKISQEKSSSWETYLRTLPVSALSREFSRLFLIFPFAIISSILVIAASYLQTPLNFTALEVLLVLGLGLLLSLPFGFMATAMAHFLSPQSSLPVMNLMYLLLSFAGGLWLPPEALPKWLEVVSPYLPTRMAGEVLWSYSLQSEIVWFNVIGLSAYLLIFTLIVFIKVKTIEKENY